MMVECRVVCVHYPKPGHARHVWLKSDEAKADKMVSEANHHGEMHPDLWYSGEVPYRKQTRNVEEWGDADE